MTDSQQQPVDHAAEALAIIHDSSHDQHGFVPLELFEDRALREFQVSMLEAQVHATLAVAEQARIANILTLARETHADIFEGLDSLGVSASELRTVLRLPDPCPRKRMDGPEDD